MPTHRLLTNCHLISPGREISGAAIEIEGARIRAVYSAGATLPKTEEVVDLENQRVLPGFIDIHTHGGLGRDVCDGQPDALDTIGRAKVREGVTTFLPTTLTLGKEDLKRAIEFAAPYMKSPTFAKAPALHIEGPFINPNCVGAQNPAFVRLPDADEIHSLAERAPIALVSIAIELAGAIDFIKAMKSAGIHTSAAHTAATYAQFLTAKAAGLNHLTHFCNQMTPLHHREIGMVGAGLLDDDIRIEIICDKIHLVPDMIRLVFRTKPLEQLMLITDSVAPSWLPDGPFTLGGLEVTVAEGVARLPSGALAGSTVRLYQALRNVHEITGLPLQELVRTTSLNQARSFGWDDLGEIKPGFRADLVVLNDDFEPVKVFVDGVERLSDAALA